MVNKLKEGGQSIKTLSYFFIISELLFKMSFNINALFSSLAVSTSNPKDLRLIQIYLRFLISVFCNPSLN